MCLPTQTNVFLPFERASDFLRSRQADVAADPWLHHEYELYSSLGVSASRRLRWGNSCVLFGTADKPGETCLPGEPAPCSRRIHYENTAMNLVLRVPRLTETQNNVRQWISDEWAVPDDGYSVSFSVVGGLVTYALPVGTNAGQLAQGLRSATESPDGAIYVVDQGRTGTATGLRGQLMRILRGIVDGTFLIR